MRRKRSNVCAGGSSWPGGYDPSMLGNAHYSLGDFSNANKYHTQLLDIAKEVVDRAGEGKAYGNLGNAKGPDLPGRQGCAIWVLLWYL